MEVCLRLDFKHSQVSRQEGVLAPRQRLALPDVVMLGVVPLNYTAVFTSVAGRDRGLRYRAPARINPLTRKRRAN
jgi:hypothetical protein